MGGSVCVCVCSSRITPSDKVYLRNTLDLVSPRTSTWAFSRHSSFLATLHVQNLSDLPNLADRAGGPNSLLPSATVYLELPAAH